MRVLILILVLTSVMLVNIGCSYWPQTLKPAYYEEGVHEVKEDIDDVTGARTL